MNGKNLDMLLWTGACWRYTEQIHWTNSARQGTSAHMQMFQPVLGPKQTPRHQIWKCCSVHR
jgi:hypothetical protein